MTLNISIKFHKKNLDGIKVKKRTRFSTKKSKGHNSVNNVGGVMVFFLCVLFDSGLYLYKVSRKYS